MEVHLKKSNVGWW